MPPPLLKSVSHTPLTCNSPWIISGLRGFKKTLGQPYDVIIFADVSIFVHDVIIWEHIGKLHVTS